MWTQLCVCLLASAIVDGSGDSYGGDSAAPWMSNMQYKYRVQGRTLAALHQTSNQYSGVLLRASIRAQSKSHETLSVQVESAEYADIHANLSQGWSTPLPESQLHYQQIPLTSNVFELKYRNGVIKAIVVSGRAPNWEVNFMKSIASQLQVDNKATNLMESRINSLPNADFVNGVYKTMEDSVGGECETLYDISPLPKVVLLSKPYLAPLRNDDQLIDIVKTQNFSNCVVPSTYHFGFSGFTNWEPASNQMGTFLSRSSVSRVVISGNLGQYLVQSSVTTNKIVVSPFLFDKQNGMVVSRLNLTLVEMKSAGSSIQSPPNPQTINSLVYEYDPASQDENTRWYHHSDQNSKLQQQKHDNTQHKHQNAKQPDQSIGSDEDFDDYTPNNNAKKQYPPMNPSSDDSDENQENQDIYSNKGSEYSKMQNKKQHSQRNKRSHGKSTDSVNTSPIRSSYEDSDSSSSSSFSWESSEEKNWNPRPTLNQAPNDPFLPMFIGNKGNSVQSAKQINVVSAVEKISQQIGSEIQYPGSIPGQMTLSKFSLLTQVVRTMNMKQMEDVTKQLYVSLSKTSSASSSDAKQYHAWVAFRDAVAQAGTGPALLTIQEWINGYKVQGEEAAQLISVLPDSAQYPNTEYMKAFFALASSPQVSQQQFLNTSALISFTELARKAFVSNSTAHNRYPVHAFGGLKRHREHPVIHIYIPYFERKLHEAVNRADSPNIRTMIVALGNFAHPRILRAFEPYLEGNKPMTEFQRLTIIAALNRMAKIYPKVVRPVFYRLYQNTGEATEVRVASVFQLMKTNPPAQLLQRMAEFTNDDQDTQVISAVQSAIRSAAENLKSPEDFELRMSAQSALNLLNPKEYPTHYSKKNVRSFWASQLDLAYKQSISYIGSDDGFVPNNIFYSLRRNMGGFQRQTVGFSAMSSSLVDMWDMLKDQLVDAYKSQLSSSRQNARMQGYHNDEQGPHHDQHPSTFDDVSLKRNQKSMLRSSSTWSNFIIGNKLGIKPSEQEQVEASLYTSTLAGKRFFAIDNHTVEQMPKLVKRAFDDIRSGRSFNYTKLTNTLSVTVAFPTAMGFPFVFTLKAPTLVYVGGSAKASSYPDITKGSSNKIEPPQSINAAVDFQFVLSTSFTSRLGFIVPYSHQHNLAGVTRNIQINVPIRTEVNLDLANKKIFSKVLPIDARSKQNLFEYSTVPFTAKRDILQLVQNPQQQLQENSNVKIVHVRYPNQIHKSFGQAVTGINFDFDYVSEQKFIDFAALYNEAHKHGDALSTFIYAWAEDSINLNNITIAYNPAKSSAQYIKMTAAYLDETDSPNYNATSTGGIRDNKNYRNSDRNDPQPTGDLYQQVFGQDGNLQMNQTSSGADSRARQKLYLQKIMAAMTDSSAMVLDASVEFLGHTKATFVSTFAAATSYTSESSHYMFFAGNNPASPEYKTGQVCWAAHTQTPEYPLMNFGKAISSSSGGQPYSQYVSKLDFGENCANPSTKISIEGHLGRSPERQRHLETSPMGQLCKKQMQEGNTVLSACRNVTFHANCLDQYVFQVKYVKMPDFWKNVTYKVYDAVRFAAYQYVQEDVINPRENSNGRVDFGTTFATDLESFNVSMDSSIVSTNFRNVRLNRYVQPLIVINTEYSARQRVADYIFQGQQFPTCVVDTNRAETFDNKSYPIKLGKCWHAMFHYTPKVDPTSSSPEDMDDEYISVLVRDISDTQKEIKVVIGENSIVLEPQSGDSAPRVTINGEHMTASKHHLSQALSHEGNILAQFYALSEGGIRLFTIGQEVEIQYDGTAVKLMAPNRYKSEVRGLCGTFNTQPLDDFTTPKGCVVEDPFLFAATYAIDDSSCEGASKALRPKADHVPCYRNVVVNGNIIGDEEQGRSSQPSNDWQDSPNFDQNGDQSHKLAHYASSCIKKQHVMTTDSNGKKCFSVDSEVEKCYCRPQGYSQRMMDFVCLKASALTRHYEDMIAQGATIDFSRKTTTRLPFKIAKRCHQ